mgnify:FL=1
MASAGSCARILGQYVEVLTPAAKLEAQGKIPVLKKPLGVRKVHDQNVVKVMPEGFKEKQLWNGYTGEVWLQPGAEVVQCPLYSLPAEERAKKFGVSLILGAGNVNSIAVCDALDKLLVENHVALIKLNPVNAYSKPFLLDVFAPFVEQNFFHLVEGGAKEGAYLTAHEVVEDVHITGSCVTHDCIVWGPGEEGLHNKEINSPKLKKPITSELGGVTPVMVAPGRWSRKDMLYQARSIAGMVLNNVSFNCIAAKLLVLDREWDQVEDFVAVLKETLNAQPSRTAYYPGAVDRWNGFKEQYPQAEELSAGPVEGSAEPHLPVLFIDNVPPVEGEYALNVEAFAPVLAVTYLEGCGGKASEFIPAAVELVNSKVVGTLGCTLIIDKSTEKENADVVDEAIEKLEYGTITLNAFTGIGFALGQTSWGAYPKHDLQNVGSGIGVVHNTFMLQNVQKSVIRAPFKMLMSVAAPWFPGHKNMLNFARNVFNFAVKPGLWRMLRTLFSAMRG